MRKMIMTLFKHFFSFFFTAHDKEYREKNRKKFYFYLVLRKSFLSLFTTFYVLVAIIEPDLAWSGDDV